MTKAYETTCPHCGEVADCTSAVVNMGERPRTEPVPTDGSISVCAVCHAYSIFSFMSRGGLRKPQPEELADFLASDTGKRLEGAMRRGRA